MYRSLTGRERSLLQNDTAESVEVQRMKDMGGHSLNEILFRKKQGRSRPAAATAALAHISSF